jgi:hypothetical protein
MSVLLKPKDKTDVSLRLLLRDNYFSGVINVFFSQKNKALLLHILKQPIHRLRPHNPLQPESIIPRP